METFRHGKLSINPVTGYGIIFYSKYANNNGYGEIYYVGSANGGKTWDTQDNLIYSEAVNNIDLCNVAGGYDSNGRLFIFFTRYDPNSPQFLSINYIFSDDDAGSFSQLNLFFDYTTINNLTSVTSFNCSGHIIDDGYNLYQTWYGDDGNGNFTLAYLSSSDRGLNFDINSLEQFYADTIPLTEPSMVYLGGGCFLVLAKILSMPNIYMQFSYDPQNGWDPNPYQTSFESQQSIGGAPWLSFINYHGIGIVACYYTIIVPDQPLPPAPVNYPALKVVFGLAKDLLNNTINSNGWTQTTIKFIKTWSANDRPELGLQSFFHPFNQFKGIGVCFERAVSLPNSSYPVIVFTDTVSMIQDVLQNLNL